ncbi:MAG: HIT domain-containing protein [Methylococcales bacterium]|nr:HIT domain-containing protein [Methylococcales bacterium]MDP3839631.1 HIT domain-containing protein [Methylococcales bacterium]
MNFQLHPRLQQDCITIGRFELCRLLMMNDSQYPWFILVPEISNLTELYQLDKTQRELLMEESCYLAENLAELFQADKMNIANIGNMVAQLHIHHIVRYQTDSAWPAPVWGKFAAVPYTEAQITERVSQMTARLSEKLHLIE